MARPEKVRLGDLLIQQKLMSQEQLTFALEQQKRSGANWGECWWIMLLSPKSRFLRRSPSSSIFPTSTSSTTTSTLNLFACCRRARRGGSVQIVLEERNKLVLIGMADPTDLSAFDEISRILKRDIDVAVVTEGQLLESIDRGYRRTMRSPAWRVSSARTSAIPTSILVR